MGEDADAAHVPLPRWWQFKKRRQIERDLLIEMLMITSKARELEGVFFRAELDGIIRNQRALQEAVAQDFKTLEARIAAAEQGVASLPVILTAWAETIGRHLAQIEALAKHHGKTGGDA